MYEFAVDVDDAIGIECRSGIGCPASAIVGFERWSWRAAELIQIDSDGSNGGTRI